MRIPARTWLAVAGLLTLSLAMGVMPGLGGHGTGNAVWSLDPDYVKRLVDAGEAIILVDLRPAEAYRKGHLPGARWLPVAELERRFNEIPRAGRVILYGDASSDAAEAYSTLRNRGYRNVMTLEEGFAGWVKRGFRVEPGQ